MIGTRAAVNMALISFSLNVQSSPPGPRLNIKTVFPDMGFPYYLYNGNPYTGRTALHWDGPPESHLINHTTIINLQLQLQWYFVWNSIVTQYRQFSTDQRLYPFTFILAISTSWISVSLEYPVVLWTRLCVLRPSFLPKTVLKKALSAPFCVTTDPNLFFSLWFSFCFCFVIVAVYLFQSSKNCLPLWLGSKCYNINMPKKGDINSIAGWFENWSPASEVNVHMIWSKQLVFSITCEDCFHLSYICHFSAEEDDAM